jgi:hypothetical protein
MPPPDARTLIVATLIIVGVPLAVHEYRVYAHHHAVARSNSTADHADWGAATSGSADERPDRGSASGDRPAR